MEPSELVAEALLDPLVYVQDQGQFDPDRFPSSERRGYRIHFTDSRVHPFPDLPYWSVHECRGELKRTSVQLRDDRAAHAAGPVEQLLVDVDETRREAVDQESRSRSSTAANRRYSQASGEWARRTASSRRVLGTRLTRRL